MHLDRHEGVVLAAELRALAVIDAFVRRLEPILVEAAGNGVDLHAEGRDRPGMDDAFGIGGDIRRTILLTGTTTGTSVDKQPGVARLELVLGLQIGGEGDLRRCRPH